MNTTASPQPSTSTPLEPRLVSIVEAARLLRIGRTAVYALISSGELDVIRFGRSVRVPVQAIDALVDRRRHVAAP